MRPCKLRPFSFAALLAVLLALSTLLCACEDVNIDDLLNDPNEQEEQNTATVGFKFEDLNDGTCALTEIIPPAATNAKLDIEIPETSPDGKLVTEIKSTGVSTYANVPRQIAAEDFEQIRQALQASVDAGKGEINKFFMTKCLCFFIEQNPEKEKNEQRKAEMLKNYPILNEIPVIYTFDDDASSEEMVWLSEFLYQYADFTAADRIAAHQKVRYETDVQYSCENIVSLTIPASVHTIDAKAFFGWLDLETVELSEGMRKIDMAAFAFNHSLKSFEFPAGLDYIGQGAFYQCKSLTAVTLPEGMSSIGDHAFAECENLNSVTVPNDAPIRTADVFDDCGRDIYHVENNIKYLGNKENPCVIAVGYTKKLNSFQLNANVKGIVREAFKDAFSESVTDIEIPEGVVYIGLSAFSENESLQTVYIPTTLIGYEYTSKLHIFDDCPSLTTVRFGGTKDEWNSTIQWSDTPFTVKCTDGDIQFTPKEK